MLLNYISIFHYIQIFVDDSLYIHNIKARGVRPGFVVGLDKWFKLLLFFYVDAAFAVWVVIFFWYLAAKFVFNVTNNYCVIFSNTLF